jgi:hypothetical protein
MGAAPDATGRIHLIANPGIGATVGVYSRWLVRQVLGWINHFILQRDLVPYQLTILDLIYMPGPEWHLHLLTTFLVYEMLNVTTSDTRHICR